MHEKICNKNIGIFFRSFMINYIFLRMYWPWVSIRRILLVLRDSDFRLQVFSMNRLNPGRRQFPQHHFIYPKSENWQSSTQRETIHGRRNIQGPFCRGSNEDAHQFYCRLIRSTTSSLHPSVWLTTVDPSYSFYPLCLGQSLPVPTQLTGDGGRTQIRQQQKPVGLYLYTPFVCLAKFSTLLPL